MCGTSPPELRSLLAEPLEPGTLRGGSLRIAFAVDLDAGRVDELVAVIRNTLRWHAPSDLLVDLDRVQFLDCAGIGALLRCQAEAAAAGCRLAVRNPRPIVARMLRLTGTRETLTGTPDTPGGGSAEAGAYGA